MRTIHLLSRLSISTLAPRGAATLAAALLPLGAALICLVPAAGASPAAAIASTADAAAIIRDVPLPVPGQIGPDVRWPYPGELRTPPDNPEVGDSWLWWLFIHYPMPPHFEQHLCTVRGKSDRAYVVVRDSDWNVSIDQADVDLILERWENSSIGPYPDQGIYEIDSTAFGIPPDELDNDPRVYLLWFDFGIAADGNFFYFDEYPEGTFPEYHSNECEVLYLNTMSQGGPSGDYMLSVIAHELEHMIHWKYDGDEVSWVTEGLAELAMWFYGRPDEISSFNTSPDNSLTNWGGNWADYIQTYLWSLYFYERYGGHPTTYALVHEPMNTTAGYDAVLDAYGYTENFADAFADWVVANFLDDPTIGDGRFGYVGEELPAFSVAGTFSSYPVSTLTRTVQYWAADYYRFQNLQDLYGLQIQFNGSDSNRFAVWALTLHASAPTEVRRMTLDALQAGTVEVFNVADPADQVILVVASIFSSGTTSYTFSAGEAPAAVPEIPWIADATPLSLQASPNPSRAGVLFRLSGNPAPATASLDLFDAEGRLVRALGTVSSSAGEAEILWDGRDAHGRAAAPGIYYARGRAGDRVMEQRIVRLP